MNISIPDHVNLYDEMRKQAKLHPKKVILEELNGKLTYSQFLLSVDVLSLKIKEVSKEERIGFYLPNAMAQVVALFALFKNEQNPCLLNFSMGTQSVIDCIETARLKTVFTSKEFIKVAELTSTVDEMEKKVKMVYLEDLRENLTLAHKIRGALASKLPSAKTRKQKEVILFTSGTENKPKGVILTHRNIYANIKQSQPMVDWTEEDRIFNPLPLFHTFGLTVGAVLPLILNVKSFLYPSPLHYKEIPKMIREDKSTIFIATDTFFYNYAKYATREDLVTLRAVFSGGERLKRSTYDKYQKDFGITILQGYGSTETSPIISVNTPAFSKCGSVGKPLPLMEFKLDKIEGMDEGGKLLVKGPNVMKGYLIHNKGFLPCDEWYDTGDIATIDHEGYIFIISRLKRFAKIAGEMISLNKIEELAIECFGKFSFYSVSIPDQHRGEKIILFTAESNISKNVFKKFIIEKGMSALYIPNKIVFIEEVPAFQTGKADYRYLAEIAKKQGD